MSVARLRQVLQGQYTIAIDSKQTTIADIQAKVAKRARTLTNKGIQLPDSKTPQAMTQLVNAPPLQFRAVDVLRKIGELTTPQWANMARLSSSWATRRYFWAIAVPRLILSPFRLSPECRDLDFHQKTLMSDEFGIGFAGLIMERLFNTNSWVDVSVALADRARYQSVRRKGRAQPDYLMWKDAPGEPFYVVECKGSQSQRNVSLNQIRRGLEQVPALRFGDGGRKVESVVIATLMQGYGSTVFVIDPKDDETTEEREKRLALQKSERMSEKLGKNVWLIPRATEFEANAWDAQRAQLLKWAGQYQSASEIESSIEIAPHQRADMEDSPLSSFELGKTIFDGVRIPLFPELKAAPLTIFLGVEREILKAVRHERQGSRAVVSNIAPRLPKLQDESSGFASIGTSGTCLVIEGL